PAVFRKGRSGPGPASPRRGGYFPPLSLDPDRRTGFSLPGRASQYGFGPQPVFERRRGDDGLSEPARGGSSSQSRRGGHGGEPRGSKGPGPGLSFGHGSPVPTR